MGFVGCGSDGVNDQFTKDGVGIPGLSRNDSQGYCVLNGIDVNWTLWSAWNAAIAEAKRSCASSNNCCKQITVIMFCGGDMQTLSNATISKIWGLGCGPCGKRETIKCK